MKEKIKFKCFKNMSFIFRKGNLMGLSEFKNMGIKKSAMCQF